MYRIGTDNNTIRGYMQALSPNVDMLTGGIVGHAERDQDKAGQNPEFVNLSRSFASMRLQRVDVARFVRGERGQAGAAFRVKRAIRLCRACASPTSLLTVFDALWSHGASTNVAEVR